MENNLAKKLPDENLGQENLDEISKNFRDETQKLLEIDEFQSLLNLLPVEIDTQDIDKEGAEKIYRLMQNSMGEIDAYKTICLMDKNNFRRLVDIINDIPFLEAIERLQDVGLYVDIDLFNVNKAEEREKIVKMASDPEIINALNKVRNINQFSIRSLKVRDKEEILEMTRDVNIAVLERLRPKIYVGLDTINQMDDETKKSFLEDEVFLQKYVDTVNDAIFEFERM